MACFVKLPGDGEKGVLTFTTPEYIDFISKDPSLKTSISEIKNEWIIGQHHNEAHKDPNFFPDPVFDFHIAGPEDLESKEGFPFYQIEMDCSNFCPDFFEDTSRDGEKFWDVLIVARNVRFKSLDDTLEIVRKVFDQKPVRILAIITHENLHKKYAEPSQTIEKYQKMFSLEERRMFTMMTPSIDYPFPFDLQTLAFFYRHSRVFFHSAARERHPRVAAYAFAAGLPLVAREQVGSLLPEKLKSPPGFYIYKDQDEAAKLILEAVEHPFETSEKQEYSKLFLSSHNQDKFKSELRKLSEHLGEKWSDSRWQLSGLDIRLARHHTGIESTNSLSININNLLKFIKEKRAFPKTEDADFEKEIQKNNPDLVGKEKVHFWNKIFAR